MPPRSDPTVTGPSPADGLPLDELEGIAAEWPATLEAIAEAWARHDAADRSPPPL